MTLSKSALETLTRAPFVIPTGADDPHDLCRKGLMAWADGAWRLTESGRAVLAAQDSAEAMKAA